MNENIIFLGTNLLAQFCLKELSKLHELNIKGVITQAFKHSKRGGKNKTQKKISPVATTAQELSLPVLMPKCIKDLKVITEVCSWKARWAILLGYGQILPKEFLSLFPKRALNLHASLLPKWRGAAPIQRAIMNDDKQMGMTLQVITPRLDAGDIIATRCFTLTDEMDSVFVFTKMEDLVQSLLKDVLNYMRGDCQPICQKESQSTYAKKIRKTECLILWTENARTVFNKIRGLSIGPQAYTFYKNKRLKIIQAQMLPTQINFTQTQSNWIPGKVLKAHENQLIVACGNYSAIRILRLQPESRKALTTENYLKGYPLKVGDQLGGNHEVKH